MGVPQGMRPRSAPAVEQLPQHVVHWLTLRRRGVVLGRGRRRGLGGRRRGRRIRGRNRAALSRAALILSLTQALLDQITQRLPEIAAELIGKGLRSFSPFDAGPGSMVPGSA